MLSHKVSSEKKPGWLFYIGDYTTQLYRDYFINHYKDPY